MKYSFIAATLSLFISTCATADMQSDIMSIKHNWAIATYQTANDKQEAAFEKLLQQSTNATHAYKSKAEPKIWMAITLSTTADVIGGFSALGKVKQARALLDEAEAILQHAHPENIHSLKESIYVSLGALYYNVPGWPIGFGDDDKANEYLKKALATNPSGIDPNYFYGSFLLEQGRAKNAIKYFNKALLAPARVKRPLADKGRKEEVSIKLAEAKRSL
ncbi:MAG: hypothetical protein A6F70_02030 [Cycloclasticus sp. symbiont of Bathymodiolus heckerae]|nr:MAG: hypothetical protein A6F70_02030 [Cycloclasticus sp. symbiont of Bathymodiolus heckerae]